MSENGNNKLSFNNGSIFPETAKDLNRLIGVDEFSYMLGISKHMASKLFPKVPNSFRLGKKLLKIKYGDLIDYINTEKSNNQLRDCQIKGGIKPAKRVLLADKA